MISGQVTRGLQPVDALEVQVLVDNVTDSLSTVPQDVTNEVPVLMKNGSLKMAAGEYRCCAHHGLSLIITARVGGDRQTLMFDAGPEAYAVSRNGALLKVPFGEAGAVVLSHGHWDHAGGLMEAVRQVTVANGGRRLECHVNAGMFVPRGTLRHGGEPLPQKPIPSPDELAAAGATVVNAPEAHRSGALHRVACSRRAGSGVRRGAHRAFRGRQAVCVLTAGDRQGVCLRRFAGGKWHARGGGHPMSSALKLDSRSPIKILEDKLLGNDNSAVRTGPLLIFAIFSAF